MLKLFTPLATFHLFLLGPTHVTASLPFAFQQSSRKSPFTTAEPLSCFISLPILSPVCLLQRRSLIGRSSNDNKAGDACGLSNPNNWARLVLKCHAWSCVKVVDSAEIV